MKAIVQMHTNACILGRNIDLTLAFIIFFDGDSWENFYLLIDIVLYACMYGKTANVCLLKIYWSLQGKKKKNWFTALVWEEVKL